MSAIADSSDGYLAGQATYTDPDSDRQTDNGWGGTLRLGKQISDAIDLELVGAGLQLERSDEPRHGYLYNLGGEALWVFNRGGFSPHLALGGGASYDDTVFDDGAGGYIDAGVGFRYPLIENGLKLRFDARYLEDFNDNAAPNEDNFGDVRISLGIELPLGGAPAAAPAPTDNDNDGVPNGRDQCPNTPANARVGTDGCALDNDGDGVPDYQDNCPNTPAGTQVNNQGCALVVDSDGDGVADSQDKCPDTPAGKPVLTNGCGTGQSTILQGVNFDLDKATLTSSARNILRRVAQTVKESPSFDLEIAGYTDATGSAQYNQRLSQRRADSVKRYLNQQGVNLARMRTHGYGESDPVASNASAAGRASNRRVELHVLKQH